MALKNFSNFFFLECGAKVPDPSLRRQPELIHPPGVVIDLVIFAVYQEVKIILYREGGASLDYITLSQKQKQNNQKKQQQKQ